MCGSGKVVDVTRELNRKEIGYVLNIVHPDVIKNVSRKNPLQDNSVDFIFIDSQYSDDQRCIGKIAFETKIFYDVYEKLQAKSPEFKAKLYNGLVNCKPMDKRKIITIGFLIWHKLEKNFR